VETEVKTFSHDLQSVHCANLWLRWWTDHNSKAGVRGFSIAAFCTQHHPRASARTT